MVNGHVDAHGMNGGAVVVGGRHGVGVFAGEVRRERGRVAREHLEEVRGVAHRWVVKGPVYDDGPLVALGIDGKHIGIKRVIGGQIEVRPCGVDVVHFDAQSLNLPLGHVDGDLRQGRFVPGLEDLRTGLHRVPDGWGTGCELPVGGLGPVVRREHHCQSVSSDVNPSGVDVDTVVGGDGGR